MAVWLVATVVLSPWIVVSGHDIRVCNLLDKAGRQRPTDFPAGYVCAGADDSLHCAPKSDFPDALGSNGPNWYLPHRGGRDASVLPSWQQVRSLV